MGNYDDGIGFDRDECGRAYRDPVDQASVRESSRASKAGCCGPSACGCGDPITSNLYSDAETSGLPPDAVAASLGCGNPTTLLALEAGQTVLDLGSGGGIDVLLSAKRVGPTGKAYGLRMITELETNPGGAGPSRPPRTVTSRRRRNFSGCCCRRRRSFPKDGRLFIISSRQVSSVATTPTWCRTVAGCTSCSEMSLAKASPRQCSWPSSMRCFARSFRFSCRWMI
jgi:hypothetical protein